MEEMEEEKIKELAKLFVKGFKLQAELNRINVACSPVEKVSFCDGCVYVTIAGEREYEFNGEEFWKEE